jgi:DNA invertase Pin-like site-specific DNA recombinase
MSEYGIAKYIRLSLDDAVSDSLSIPNQRALLDRHIDSLDIPNAEVLEFVDNGYTGTNLQRPALQEMLDLAQSGRVNCILVKDFSRFARNEIESSYYVEQVFPIYRIRFISVSDGFDSNDYRDGTGGIEVAFKFLMHEHYSLDLSKKIKSARRVKMKSGDNIVANAIYGYRKNMTTGKWEQDTEAAAVVKLIFQKALDSVPVSQIRNYLSAAKYPTPGEYIKMKRGKDITPECAWNTTSINAILVNEQYAGSYVSGKYEAAVVGSGNHIVNDKSEWIVIPDSHPAIVSKEDFTAVQKLLGRIKGGAVEIPVKRLFDTENKSYRSRMVSGGVITGTPTYGYGQGENGKWIISEPTASRVREMFDMVLRGLSIAEIRDKVREAGYPTPSEHIKLTRGQNIMPECRWTEGSVRLLLKNVQYTGAYVSGKVRRDYETNKLYKMRECDWIVIPGKHPAIISSDIFERVQDLLRTSKKRRKVSNAGELYLSAKVIKCGCCGYGLHYVRQANPPRYYCKHTLALPDAKCYKMKVNASELEHALLTIIRKQAEVVIGSDDLTGFRKPNEGTRKMTDCENRIKELSERRVDCYERFLRGEIDRDTFMSMKNEYTAQIDEINTQAALLRQIGRDKDAKSKIVAVAKEVMSETAATKDIVNALVDRVFVFPDKRLEIHWKFEDFMKP